MHPVEHTSITRQQPQTDHSAATEHPQEPHWLTAAEQRTWRSFLFGSRAMLRAIDKQLTRDSNLSGAEYDVLVPLSESPSGVLRSRDLLEFLGWERSRLSHLLVRMDRRSLIQRKPCDDDARGLDVSITPQGRRAIEAAAPAHLAMVRAVLMDELTEDETRAINSIYDKLTANLRAHDLG
ncbi:MarR family winged helix-turn-helix transcriptional regulator [Kocuria sp.]|uniref:MarR family winged helix-turn-helix transcriptional regulator n=1 Tax=Kocuria sp. TaxID=1871328 RepID=UPI0026DF6E46|nr:MarR family winged helix-turn-helix transcriptional regulator [Kocuria sp.]MDO5618643.1 MarR family winged helix-turn-helix transcriptional regulator [Kocuria sp.]